MLSHEEVALASLGVLAFGWPVQHTLSAAALALTMPALARPARRLLASIIVAASRATPPERGAV